MLNKRLPSRPRRGASRRGLIILIVALVLVALGAAYLTLNGLPLPVRLPVLRGGNADLHEAVSDVNGLAFLDTGAGTINFQITSGLSGERLPGIRVLVAVSGGDRLMYAEDPTGAHLPVAVPLAGDATVRRLVMPPLPSIGANITTAAPSIDTRSLPRLGTLTEAQLRDQLRASGDQAVLLYLYDPAQPLALTGAALDVYATDFRNVYVLRPGVQEMGGTLAMVVVSLEEAAYDDWGHIGVDRYLAGRVGQPAATDLAADLAFPWAYPVFDVFPPEPTLDLGTGDTVTFQIRWRSQNPDPPPPWSFFVTLSEEDRATLTPESFGLGPDTPSQEVSVTVNRQGLAVGEYSLKVFIQPFSDTFGLIEQAEEREITFTVAEALPTPTAGPSVSGLTYTPDAPREGDRLAVTGGGFTPGEAVLVEFTGPESTFSDALPVADEDGVLHYEINLEPVPAGTYTLRLTGSQSGVGGEATVVVGEGVADAIVATVELNLRVEPFSDSPVLEILARGDELTVISVNYDDSWIEVITKTGEQGWVMTQWVTLNIDLANVPWNSKYPAP